MNYSSNEDSKQFDDVWKSIIKERQKFSCYLLRKMKKNIPDQAERAE